MTRLGLIATLGVVLGCQETTASAPPRAGAPAPAPSFTPAAPLANSSDLARQSVEAGKGSQTTASASHASRSTPGACALRVEVQGLRNNRGRVSIALFNSEDGFPDQEKAVSGKVVRIARKHAEAQFGELRCGQYAVAVLHDENQSGDMDYMLFGMPSEGFGFSNDAPVSFGPPSFEAAAFQLNDAKRVKIAARYF